MRGPWGYWLCMSYQEWYDGNYCWDIDIEDAYGLRAYVFADVGWML